MSLEIFSSNQWTSFHVPDLADTDKLKELKSLSHFAMVLKASGHELDHIRARFEHLPVTKGNICIWRNPFCEFILSNLVE